MFEAYLAQYPGGDFAALAKLKRDKLVEASQSETQTAALVQPPKSTLQIEEMDLDMVALKTANVRSGPSTTNEKLTRLEQGSRVTVTGSVDDGRWYRVALVGGDEGYVFGELLGEKPAQIATVVPVPAPQPESSVQPAVGVYPPKLKPGDTFKDCDDCPENEGGFMGVVSA